MVIRVEAGEAASLQNSWQNSSRRNASFNFSGDNDSARIVCDNITQNV